MKLREFLKTLSTKRKEGFSHPKQFQSRSINATANYFEQDQEILVPNIELRFLEPEISNLETDPERKQESSVSSDENAERLVSKDYRVGNDDQELTNCDEFIDPGPGEGFRVYNSPNERLPNLLSEEGGFLGGDGVMSRFRDAMIESDPLRGSLEALTAFGGTSNSRDYEPLFQTGVYKARSWQLKVAFLLGFISILVVIALTTATLLLRAKDAAATRNNASTIQPLVRKSTPPPQKLGVPPHLLNLKWPLPDISSYDRRMPEKELHIRKDLEHFLELPETSTTPMSASLLQASFHSPNPNAKESLVQGSSVNVIPIPIIFLGKRIPVNASTLHESIVAAQEAKKVRDVIESGIRNRTTKSPTATADVYYKYFNRIETHNSSRNNTEKDGVQVQDQAFLPERGFLMQETYRQVVKRLNLTKEEANQGLILLNGTLPTESCTVQKPHCNELEKYRSFDGSCNNLQYTDWGKADEPFRRVLFPHYEDGVSSPRIKDYGGDFLPTAREISHKIHTYRFKEDDKASLIFPLWAEFIYNDIIYTPVSSDLKGNDVSCCDDGKLGNISSHPECLLIIIPSDDPTYNINHTECLPYTRSAYLQNCLLGPREQLNQMSSYIDASNVYGTSSQKSWSLRAHQGGLMKFNHFSDGRTLLPELTDKKDVCNQAEKIAQEKFCFEAGDPRVNEVATLTSLHTIWLRQHNHIANMLSMHNPHWDDERLFQETRKVISAQIQHITYSEFLPLLLGPELMKNAKLNPVEEGHRYYDGHDPKVNPTASNAFGSAFKFLHSMTEGLIKLVERDAKNETFLQIGKLYLNPFIVYDKGMMESIIRGLSSQPASRVDVHFSKQLTEHFYQSKNESQGLDLVSMIIQQGRDHGLPPYSLWRKVCNLSEVNTFDDLDGIWSNEVIMKVSKVYSSIKDVDFYTGILAEKHIQGGRVGPTLACIVADQFVRLRQGDRFWYEGDIQIDPFSIEQINAIKSITLAKILCDNTDHLSSIQPKPMMKPSSHNHIVFCREIPRVNYVAWKDKSNVHSVSGLTSNGQVDDKFKDLEDEDWEPDSFEDSLERIIDFNVTSTKSDKVLMD